MSDDSSSSVNSTDNDASGIGRDHIYVGAIPGLRRWSTDYEQIAEWAGGEENVSIMHKRGREYVLDLSSDAEVVENQEACVNQQYDCGHVAYGPPTRLPAACPQCRPVATDGGGIGRMAVVNDPPRGIDDSGYKRGSNSDHMWLCPNCSRRNSARYMSCRQCPTLRWGVVP